MACYKPRFSDAAGEYHEKMFPGCVSDFIRTDPEFIERFDELLGVCDLDDRTRHMAWLATLLGCQGIDEFRCMVPAALNLGVTPIEIKEIVYQSVAYLGIGRIFPFLKAVNEILEDRGIELPLEPQATTTMENRREAGTQAQVDIFGEGMRDFWKNGDSAYPHINRWLAANCFGDWYTRGGLDLRQREMVTFCYIAAQGGCDTQLRAHASGNLQLGNDRKFMLKVISSNVPFIGYPRTLNAISALEAAASPGAE
jgi:4-carboxymuconolactone decarboxylase